MTITITRQHLRLLLLFAAGALFGLFIFAVTRAEADTTSESTFIPISPCRLFDTRPGIDTIGPRNTPLTAGETHLQDVHGTNGNCTIPTDATAVAMNITAINATNPTFITIWPADTATMPLASILNPTPERHRRRTRPTSDCPLPARSRFTTWPAPSTCSPTSPATTPTPPSPNSPTR